MRRKTTIDGAAELHALEAELLKQTVTTTARPGLRPPALLPSLTTTAAPHPAVSTAPTRGPTLFRVVGIVSTALGGASLVVGGILGGLALDRAASARASLPLACTPDGACPPSEEAAVTALFQPVYTLATASDAFLAGGALTAAAGVLLLLLDPTPRAAPSLPLRPVVAFSPSGASFRLQF